MLETSLVRVKAYSTRCLKLLVVSFVILFVAGYFGSVSHTSWPGRVWCNDVGCHRWEELSGVDLCVMVSPLDTICC